MDLKTEETFIVAEIKNPHEIKAKRKLEDNEFSSPRKKSKPQHDETSPTKQKQTEIIPESSGSGGNIKVPQSPKKRLAVPLEKSKNNVNKPKFIYGNYSQYYGYRNKNKDFHDIRLDVFAEHMQIFQNKQVLDIGCNSGFITMEVAKKFQVKSIVGLDIDKALINQATKLLINTKKTLPINNELRRQQLFPFNVSFIHGNYILRNKVLLEIEQPQFDLILCLSITKWLHLNFGDEGLQQAFKRMYLQLRPQGMLILEPQPFDNYGRRKKMTVSKAT